MRVRGHFVRCWLAAIVCGAAPGGWALDPHRSLTQYSRTVWTQADGLPQDTIKAIVQTADGYLWLGTDEGLARFDGYEFTTFDKSHGDLPSNSITALAATADGGLWIGTASGLTEYRDKRFRTFTTRDGLPDAAITGLYADHEGALWVVAGGGARRPGESPPPPRPLHQLRARAATAGDFGAGGGGRPEPAALGRRLERRGATLGQRLYAGDR